MKKIQFSRFLVLVLLATLAACQPYNNTAVSFNPEELQFSGESAYQIEEQFVTSFPNRESGSKNSQLAVIWLAEQLTEAGFDCQIDSWQVINYSQPVDLQNVVCRLMGQNPQDPREILVIAHHDAASTTVQGADNDGSGIAILLQLAQIFGSEEPPAYSLVFVATDAEEYGMIGSQRFIETHPEPEMVVAGLSLDNLGRSYYKDMNMELIGQYRGYGDLWLAELFNRVADASDKLWQVNMRIPLDQILDQAAPVSFMDQGPLVAAGVPAMGLAGGLSAEYGDFHYHLWHHPDDTMEYQSAEALAGSGLLTEALLRQLLSMKDFPEETGPYLYFEESNQVLRGLPLTAIFVAFTALYFVASYFTGENFRKIDRQEWLGAIVHFLGFWLPLAAAVSLLYLMVDLGALLEYKAYPATTKDPELLNPDWGAIALFLSGLAVLLWAGRSLARKYFPPDLKLPFKTSKKLALLLIGLMCLFVIFINPFSLLFIAPTLAWLLMRGKAKGKLLDLVFFLLGGLLIYALIYFFGFIILRYGLTFLWMFMNMIATGTIGFRAMMIATAVIASGLSMLVPPPAVKPQK